MSPDTGWATGPTLSAWIYDSPRGAAAGQVRLHRLCRRDAVAVVDAATVMWARGAHRPRIGYLPSGAPAGGRHRSPLGALLERLMLSTDPASPTDPTDAADSVARQLSGTGLGADFLRGLRLALVPGTSGLLVLSRSADLDQVQLVIERGVARGDVRLLHVVLGRDALTALDRFASRGAAAG
jgi:uncharacterized membrane protein